MTDCSDVGSTDGKVVVTNECSSLASIDGRKLGMQLATTVGSEVAPKDGAMLSAIGNDDGDERGMLLEVIIGSDVLRGSTVGAVVEEIDGSVLKDVSLEYELSHEADVMWGEQKAIWKEALTEHTDGAVVVVNDGSVLGTTESDELRVSLGAIDACDVGSVDGVTEGGFDGAQLGDVDIGIDPIVAVLLPSKKFPLQRNNLEESRNNCDFAMTKGCDDDRRVGCFDGFVEGT